MRVVKKVKELFSLCQKSSLLKRTFCSRGFKNGYVVSPFPDVEIPTHLSVPDFLESKANESSWSHRLAFESWSDGRKYTFQDVFQMGHAMAQNLRSLGFRKGDVVCVALGNVPEYAAILFGIWWAGLIPSPCNPYFTQYEFIKQLEISDAKGLIISEKHAELSSTLKTACPNLARVFLHGKDESLDKMFRWDKANTPIDLADPRSDVAMLLFSSGTTGLPKGVGLSHYNMLANLLQITHPGVTRVTSSGEEKLIGVLPFYHSFGFNSFIQEGMGNGAHTLCLQKFDAESFHLVLEKHKPTCVHLVAPLVNHIIQNPVYTPSLFECVEYLNLGASPMGPALLEKLLAKIGRNVCIREGYGLTEFTSATHLVPPGAKLQKLGSCGVPLPNTVTKIVDPTTGATLEETEVGEICIRGPQMMLGYWKNEKATAETIDADGWFHTGDIGHYDADGYFYIVERIKDLIKVKGFQVSPTEIESVLREHPEVGDVGVCGVPHSKFGEAPRAFVVPRTNTLQAETLHDFIKSRLSPYKHLNGGLVFVHKIPKSDAGKILRKELRNLDDSYCI